MAGESHATCIDKTLKKPASVEEAGFFLWLLKRYAFKTSSSVGLDANAFELTRGNALFPLGRAGDVGTCTA